MTRRRRTRILVDGNPDLRRSLADAVRESYPVVEIVPPESSLVMAKMRETAKRTLFYIGELLVTEAKVRVSESLGLGLIAGDHPEAAVDLAVIDGAYNAELALCAEWEPLLAAEEERLGRAQAQEESRLQETRVAFQRMQTEEEQDDGP